MKQSQGFRTIAAFLAALPLIAAANGDLRLVDAARDGDLEAVRSLLESEQSAGVAKADGTTALHYAAHRDDLQMAMTLLKAGADAGAANIYGITPLSLACTNRGVDMVELLLKAGAAADAVNASGETVLMDCVRTGTTGGVAALLKADADPEVKENIKGQTPLMWAAAGGHAGITRLLIEHGADIHAKTPPSVDRVPNDCRICEWKPSPGGFTPLMFAARSGDIETVRLLLEAGADIDQATAEYGNPLVIASASGHEDLALFLLQSGADLDSTDENGVTALHHALQQGLSTMYGVTYDPSYRQRPKNMPRLARALLEAGADPNARITTKYYIGPAIRSSCESIDAMVGATPFMLAAISADVELLETLYEHEADPALPTDDGTTPLMAAARSACTGQNQDDNLSPQRKHQAFMAVKAIVAMGADINAVNKEGETAMHKAAFTGAEAVVKYLAEQGAGVQVRNKDGETPWSMASGIAPSFNNVGSYGVHPATAALLLELGARPVTREEMNTPDAYSNFGDREISIDHGDATAQPE